MMRIFPASPKSLKILRDAHVFGVGVVSWLYFLRRDLSRSRATRNSVKLSGLQQNVVFFKDLSTDETAGAHQTHQCGSRITNFQMQSLVPNVLLWPSPKTASTVSNNRTFLTQTHIIKTTASLRRPRRLYLGT
jgi:hypothetical protein